MTARSFWISAAILTLAFALRITWLDLKPAHFDEGVNGAFVDQMTRQGYYHYDPTNFHGPFHFYVLFVSQTLFGRNLWALRLPVVLVSTASVGLVLCFRRFLDERACQIAALAMAVSPGMIFFGRSAIHEAWLPFFLLLTVWGLAGLWRFGTSRYLWAAALGATGMVLTKETYIIHFIALLLAVPCLLGYERLSPSAPWVFGGWKFSLREVGAVGGVCAGLIVFFYTGGLLDWSALPGLWETFGTWVRTGTEQKSGHEKAWYYWAQLAGQYEWTTLAGVAAGLGLLFPRTPRVARYLAIYGVGTLIGYSIVPYKTPWCVISLIWPFYFVFGLAIVRASESLDKWTARAVAAVLCLGSFGAAAKLNLQDYTNDEQPYVYVQTFTDVNELLFPLQELARRDARNFQIRGHIILPEQYPWIWSLGAFPRIDYPMVDQLPEPIDAEFLLIDQPLVEQIEPTLRSEYYRFPMKIRGNSENAATLYLSPGTFRDIFPADTPKFMPGSAEDTAPAPDAR